MLLTGVGRAQDTAIGVAFNESGLASVKSGSLQMLVDQPPVLAGQFVGESYQHNIKALSSKRSDQSVQLKYERATLAITFKPEADRIKIDATLRNDSDKVMIRAAIKPLRLRFPQRPTGIAWRVGNRSMAWSPEEPAVVVADFGRGMVALCIEDPLTNAGVGFTGNNRGGLEADVTIEAPGDQRYEDQSLQPGGTFSASVVVRFAKSGTSYETFVGDVHRSYAKRFPPTLNWRDNRPIGALFLARDATRWEKNPRGWFNDDKLDITTPEGKEKFRQRLMEYADRSIKVIKETGGQGMITWDIEGGEFPHATTYLGDPRSLPFAAPEMDAVADEYFKKFRDAGLKTGICIRPTTIVAADGAKYPWIRTRLGHMDNVDALENISDKIAYAKKRWGCTIFYMDTPGLYKRRNGPMSIYFQVPPDILRKVCERFPDVLLIPEYSDDGGYGSCSVYGELGARNRTPDDVRLTYPDAFTCFAVKDNPMYPNWDQIVTGVRHGDILIFRGWFGDHLNTRVLQAWTEAQFSGKELTAAVRSAGEDKRKLTALLNDADALVQYQAATQLARAPGPEAIAPLITTLQSQSPWIVRRAATQTLGKIGGAEAIAALTQSMNKPKSDLQYFAAIALGDCGSNALPALTAALDSTDHQRWEAVAAALVRISGPAPEPAMLRVLSETKPVAMQARRVVLASLRNQPRPALFDAVVALLSVGGDVDRTRVAQTLGAYKNHRAIEPLLKVLDDPSKDLYQTKKAAMYALEDITGRDSSSKEKVGGGENAATWRKLLNTGNKP